MVDQIAVYGPTESKLERRELAAQNRKRRKNLRAVKQRLAQSPLAQSSEEALNEHPTGQQDPDVPFNLSQLWAAQAQNLVLRNQLLLVEQECRRLQDQQQLLSDAYDALNLVLSTSGSQATRPTRLHRSFQDDNRKGITRVHHGPQSSAYSSGDDCLLADVLPDVPGGLDCVDALTAHLPFL